MNIHLRRTIVLSMTCGLILCAAAPATAAGTETFPQSVASGDPQPDSVVVWTRVADAVDGDSVAVEVSSDPDFTNIVASRVVSIESSYDGAVKVLVDGLEPGTFYWYRFTLAVGKDGHVSPVGRTKTAPAPGDPQPVRFAVVNCQDYTGRYYNSYMRMLRDYGDDLDFVLHVGDYIYETTGDPTFQDPTMERMVVFEDIDGAIPLGSPDSPFYAASSLANYRTLYQTFRSDPMLQEVHERWPMVAVWDDHEYSDDCWGATATYTDERVDEMDVERRRRAEQVFFEWMPTRVGLGEDGVLAIDDSMLYPNAMLYQSLRFGAYLDLAVTDYRSFRPDHLVAEDAFPGAIAVDEAGLRGLLGDPVFEALAGSFDPYIDMDVLGAAFPIFKQTCTMILSQLVVSENPGIEATHAIAHADALLTGKVSTLFLNSLFEAGGLTPVFAGDWVAELERGLPYLFVGKTALNDSLGSRYLLLKQGYDLISAARFFESGGAAQDALGAAQMGWLVGHLTTSDAVWNVLASSVSMTPMILDFTHPAVAPGLPPEFPEALRTQIMVNVDQWDGFPHGRAALQWILASRPNTVVVSGDIHSWFVTDHQNGLIEFTAPAISSQSLGEMILSTLEGHPVLGQIPGLEQLVASFGPLMQLTSLDDTVTHSDIVDLDLQASGFLVVEADADALTGTMVYMPSSEVPTNYYDDPDGLDEVFQSRVYRVEQGQVTRVDN